MTFELGWWMLLLLLPLVRKIVCTERAITWADCPVAETRCRASGRICLRRQVSRIEICQTVGNLVRSFRPYALFLVSTWTWNLFCRLEAFWWLLLMAGSIFDSRISISTQQVIDRAVGLFSFGSKSVGWGTVVTGVSASGAANFFKLRPVSDFSLRSCFGFCSVLPILIIWLWRYFRSSDANEGWVTTATTNGRTGSTANWATNMRRENRTR